MGIRIRSSVINGVQFYKNEAKAVNKWIDKVRNDGIFMDFIEYLIKIENKYHDSKYTRRVHTFSWFMSPYLDFRKNGKAFLPLRPFWVKYSKTNIEKMRKGYFDSFYHKYTGKDSDEKYCPLCLPGYNEYFPMDVRVFGLFYVNSRYSDEVDYAAYELLANPWEKDNGTQTIARKVPGKRPWETGVTRFRDDNREWYAHNGEHMLSRDSHKKMTGEEKNILMGSFRGEKSTFVRKRKQLWDKYRDPKFDLPCKNYLCEGWGYSQPTFAVVHQLMLFIQKNVPEFKYNPMRLDRYLCYWWS